MENRQILHIDMNSFFATAEQQANPYLRGKPLGVRGSKAKRTIIAASSIEAKRLGIKTGLRVHEAQEICPDINIVVGEPRKYSDILRRLVRIFERYTDVIEIFSIDECFLDVTKTATLFTNYELRITNKAQGSNLKESKINHNSKLINHNSSWDGAIEIARRIKGDIRRELGEWMTCSIGISYNKFLAKYGSDMEKPDGLVTIVPNSNPQIPNSKQIIKVNDVGRTSKPIRASKTNNGLILTVDGALLGAKLTDFCGIAGRLDKRLKKIGITTVKQLREADDLALKNEFGVYGLRMKRWSWGIDNTPVLDHRFQADAKSFTRARTLNRNIVSKQEMKRELYLLAENLGTAMRAEKYWGKTVGIWLRYQDFSGIGQRHKYQRWISSGYDLYKAAEKILDGVPIRTAVRAIGIYVTDIQKEKYVPQSLLTEDRMEERVTKTVDKINDKYGETIVRRGVHANMEIKKVVSGLGRKII
jgi:DNA polymerase-4